MFRNMYANKLSFSSFFPSWMTFSCFTTLSRTTSTSSVKHPCFVPSQRVKHLRFVSHLGGKQSVLSSVSIMKHADTLYQVEEVSFISKVLRILSLKDARFFQMLFLCTGTMWFLLFIWLISYTIVIDLGALNYLCIPGTWCIILFKHCWIQFPSISLTKFVYTFTNNN